MPTFQSLPQLQIVGLSVRSTPFDSQIPSLWGKLVARIGEIRHRVGDVAYGVVSNFDPASNQFDYLAGYAVSDAASVPADMSILSIPPQHYAVFDCTIPTIGAVMHHIYQEWLPTSGYKRAESAEFEFYPETFQPSQPDSILQLYIPIQKP
ncbi:MAG TPA: GyrI-like domain-containing protein [Anaerolineales bacterium]|nr:GyrI-like domain-containing protein [Anaerolineales bacterium]